MNTVLSVLKDFAHFFHPKTKKGRIWLALLIVSTIVGIVLLKSGTGDTSAPVVQNRAVETVSVSSFSEGASLQLIGTVSATNRAVIQSESAGRVVGVPVELGSAVSAGQIIVQLENASEYASVLQAEGAYEATLASAQVSDVSLAEAKNTQQTVQNSVISTYRGAYTTTSNVMFNTLDDFFSDPYFSTPGVKIDTGGNAAFLNDERFAFNDILTNWQEKSVAITSSEDLDAALVEAVSYTQRVIKMVDIFITAIEQESSRATLNGVSLSTYAVSLSSVRTTLNATLGSLESSVTALQNARELVKKAELGGTTNEVSSANAQVKQALGALRAAQANYNKTILRSPIAGVVNSIDVQTGDFVSSFEKVAEIANNDALEVTTYVGQSDRELISMQQEVLIDGVATGVVSTIAPAVNPSTGKIEVKIQSTSPELINGDTVIIALESQEQENKPTQIQVPLTAVKFTAAAGSVFTVEDGKLVAYAVEIGAVRDIYIEIISGLTSDMEVVVDARGLTSGQEVTTITN